MVNVSAQSRKNHADWNIIMVWNQWKCFPSSLDDVLRAPNIIQLGRNFPYPYSVCFNLQYVPPNLLTLIQFLSLSDCFSFSLSYPTPWLRSLFLSQKENSCVRGIPLSWWAYGLLQPDWMTGMQMWTNPTEQRSTQSWLNSGIEWVYFYGFSDTISER